MSLSRGKIGTIRSLTYYFVYVLHNQKLNLLYILMKGKNTLYNMINPINSLTQMKDSLDIQPPHLFTFFRV